MYKEPILAMLDDDASNCPCVDYSNNIQLLGCKAPGAFRVVKHQVLICAENVT